MNSADTPCACCSKRERWWPEAHAPGRGARAPRDAARRGARRGGWRTVASNICGEAAWLAPDSLPMPGVIGELGRRNALRIELVQEAELGQLTCRVGHHVDPDAELHHAP